MSEYALGVWGLVLGVLGIVIGAALAVYYYRRGDAPARLLYSLSNEPLWRPTASDAGKFELTFEGRPVENAGKCRLFIWSLGPQTVAGDSISQADPLRIEFPSGVEVLSVDVPRQIREASEFAVDASDSRAAISFAFLDKGDGALITVLYANPANVRARPSLRGAIRGVPKGVQRNRTPGRLFGLPKTLAEVAGMVAIVALGALFSNSAEAQWPIFVVIPIVAIAYFGWDFYRDLNDPRATPRELQD